MKQTSTSLIDYGRLRQDIVRILQHCRSGKANTLFYDIEDLVQDTIARAIGREGTPAAFDPSRSSWVTWIVRVADDCLRTAYRRQRAAKKGMAAVYNEPDSWAVEPRPETSGWAHSCNDGPHECACKASVWS